MASRARTATPPPRTRRNAAPKAAPKAAAVEKPAGRAKPASTAIPAVPTTPAISSDAIAERAYYIWLRKGRPYGQDDQNWIDAEAELTAELKGV